MKGLYHLCYTSHSEVICRNNNDYERLICRIAQISVSTSSQILAYTVMSTHVHLILQTDSPSSFCKRLRHSYTASFNHKYFRKGTLGEKLFFCRQLKHIEHIAAAISYVLRNPVHHNVALNPFSYPYSTVSLYFRSSIEGLVHRSSDSGDSSKVRQSANSSLCRKQGALKGNVAFLDTGAVDPLSFVEIRMVENYFGTYNAFQYNLHRRDYQEWVRVQKEAEKEEIPITLHSIEPWMSQKQIDSFERKSQHWYREEQISDMELCMEIDREVQCLGKNSYVQLSHAEKIKIASKIRMRYPGIIQPEQFARCFGGW